MLESWDEGGYVITDPEGPAGEIILGGSGVANGYFKHDDPYDNLAFFTDESGMRWFRTGDIGQLDPTTNALSIVDRKKQLVKMLNGEYVSLAKVECALMSSSFVEMACVFNEHDKGLVAVVIPNMQACSQFRPCKEETISAEELEGLVGKSLSTQLSEVLASQLKEVLAPFEMPKGVLAVEGPWTPESGLVTGALKTRRKAIGKKYCNEISSLFNSI